MDHSILYGSDAPPPRWLGVAWTFGAGYLMGVVALAHIFGGDPRQPDELFGRLLLGVVPGLLSAGAALLGVRCKHVATAILLTMIGSLIASLLCAPLTWCLLALMEHPVYSTMSEDAARSVAMLAVVTLIGAFIGAPLGLGFGLVFSTGIALLVALRRRSSRASLDAALVVLGLGWTATGAAMMTLLATTDIDPVFGSTALQNAGELVWVSGALAALGLGVALTGGARWVLRRWLTSRIRSGKVPGWAIVRAEEVDDAADLPRLFPLGRIDGVLVRRARTSEGPFRSGEPSTALARVAV